MNGAALRMVFLVLLAMLVACRCALAADVIVAEGEEFTPQDDKGWKVTHQDDSYASHTYGGMWVSHGGLLGAPADSNGSVAVKKIAVPAAGDYRVWSRYQAPPYFNYMHKIEVAQGGKVLYSHTYGRKGTDRFWSFGGVSDEMWWSWGVDHDVVEAPNTAAKLQAGQAELRLVTVGNAAPAGDPMVDFVVLTSDLTDKAIGPRGTLFSMDAFAATQLYMRFQNAAPNAAKLKLRRGGHYQPLNYRGGKSEVPDAPVAAGQWSSWVNIGPFCRLVHDEGVWMTLDGAGKFKAQFARDAAGKDIVGDTTVHSGEAVVIPVDISWNKDRRVLTSREYAVRLRALAQKEWRTANAGRKPKEILYYGAFNGQQAWLMDLKDALGYNTMLPDRYEHAACDRLHAHTRNPQQISAYAAKLADKKSFKVLSFGDEIHIGHIKFDDPQMQTRFTAWIKAKKLTRADLGVTPAQAKLAERANSPRIAWYAELFSNEVMFEKYRNMTAQARREIGPQVETGANYSPHYPLPQYYGRHAQWIDIFKHDGMSMFWTEDYIFSVTQPPQIFSWMFAMVRCATKYKGQKIHMYVMPHAPGQIPEYLRRNMVLSIGYGSRHIDNFWVAPAENFTENFISWGYTDMFQVVHEAIYDSAEAEPLQVGGKVRPARVAIVLSRATDHNEARLAFDPAKDPFMSQCRNAAAEKRWNRQTLCRKEQQMLYLALRHAQHAVDLITEDDILDGVLKDYEVVHFAGEWIDHRTVPVLEKWVRGGGTLYACAGLGHLNEFNENYDGMLKLLGLKGQSLRKNVYILRPYLELPLAEPIDAITLDGGKVAAMAMRQQLVPADAKVIGTWSDGKPAVTVRELGKGRAFAVGTLPGTTYLKTGLRLTPWARGGRKMVYNPTGCDEAAARLAWLGLDAAKPEQDVVCSNNYVEGIVMDHPKGTLLTLVNWDNEPVGGLEVSVRLKAEPEHVRSVQWQRTLKHTYKDGVLTFTTDLEWADYFLMPK